MPSPTLDKIFMADVPAEEKLLRTKMPAFDFAKHDAKETRTLIARMKRSMHAAHGIGLSANQIGLKLRVFVGQVPDANGALKFYAIFNPEIEKASAEKTPFEEGCLSVPGTYGQTMRPETVVLKGFDSKGKPVKIKAWGLLAKMFQHEMDHLNGILFIDKAKNLHYEDPEARRNAVARWKEEHP